MSEHAAAAAQPQKTVVPAEITKQPELLLRRKCACGASAGFAGECKECDGRRLQIQRRSAKNSSKTSFETGTVEGVLEEEGAGLDEATRAFMESRFRHDFSSVRVHTDARAAESARNVNALAYTVGQHVVFGAGHYQPHTQTGRHLIAHELTHTIQQSGTKQRATQAKLEVGEESDELEREADRAADRVMKGGLTGSAPPLPPPATPPQSSSLLIQRAPDSGPASSTQTGEEAADATSPSTLSLIVEDDADQLAAGQMRKSEFLAELRAATCAAADSALARIGRNTESCPYISRAFAHYQTQDSRRLERGLRRYAPEAAGAKTARGYIEAVSARVARAVGVWAETGEVTDVPEELASEMSGSMWLGGAKGLASLADKAVGGLIGKAGKALSGLGKMLFKARAGGANLERAEPAVIKSQLNDGETLDGGVKSRMERAFGHDFSRVRVYTDARAAELSANLNSRAFTVGSSVAFAEGEYRPGTLVGDALIAHELAHVVQQGDAGENAHAPLTKPDEGTATDALEADADVAAVGAVASIWGGFKHGLVKFSKKAMPRLKTGLQLQSCKSHDYEINGLSQEQTNDSIYFERKSSDIKDQDQKDRIENLKSPAGSDLRLFSFVSEDENIPPEDGKELAHSRYKEVDEALRKDPNKHTGKQIPGDGTKPAEDTTSSKGQMDYRNWRKVKVVSASQTSSGQKDCSTGAEQPCSAESQFTNAQSKVEAFLKPSFTALQNPLDPKTKTLLTTHFHTTTDAEHTSVAKIVEANLTKVQDHVKNQMSPIGTAGSTSNPAKPGHVCANECDAGCGQGAVAYNTGTDADALMVLCDVPSNPGAFMQQADEPKRIHTLVHEGMHGVKLDLPAGAKPTAAGGAVDYSYKSGRLMRFLDTETALKNNDSYVLFAREAGGETPDIGPKTPDPEMGPNFFSDSERKEVDRALAFMAGQMLWTEQEFIGLYITVNESVGKTSWTNSHYEETMGRIADLFEMTKPPATPKAEDQVKVAALHDRLVRLSGILKKNINLSKDTKAETHWEKGPTSDLTIGKDFFKDKNGARSARAQFDMLLELMLEAAPDISSDARPKYIKMLDQIRQQKGGGAP